MHKPGRRALWVVGYGVALILFATLAFRLFQLYLPRNDLDHGVHVAYAERLLSEHVVLPHFAYHVLVALAAGLSSESGRLASAAAAVLTILVLAKIAVSLGFARWWSSEQGAPLGPAGALGLAIVCFFAAPLPKWWHPENIYLGQLSPLAWHNPTVITLLPVAVATFWVFLRRLPKPRLRDDLEVGAWLGLSVLAKPNFALAFLPTLLVLRLRRGCEPRRLAVLIAPSLLVLGWQYQHALALGLEPPGSGMVTLQPLLVWRLYSPHPLVSAFVSLAFPLSVAWLSLRERRASEALVAAWLLSAVAIAEFALLAQPEPALGDANYYWGVVPAVFILFLVSASELLAGRVRKDRPTALVALCWALLVLHVASGVFLYAYPFQLAVAD